MQKFFLICFVILSVVQASFSQWNANPSINTPVCVQPNTQRGLHMVTDTKGGAIISWEDFRSGDTTIAHAYTQRINSLGNVKWTLNGIRICANDSDQGTVEIIADGAGGAILCWNDHRGTDRDIYAQRVDSSGNLLWGANGVVVVAKLNDQRDSKMISDGSGGAIIAWQDSVNADLDIYAQRISGTGTTMWTAGGVSICTAASSQINDRVVTDGAGGAIIVWQDKRNGQDYDIYTQRVNVSGAVQWAGNGVSVASNAGTQSNPKLRSDGNGGAIIVWQDKRNGVDYDIYTQRVNASGAIQWTLNGMVVCSATGSQTAVDITNEGISGAVIAWKDLRNGNYDIYAQKVNLSGATQWATNGVAITTANFLQINPNLVGDGTGGAIIVWPDSSTGQWDVNSSRINSSGVIQWTVPVGSASLSQVSPKNVSDGAGGCIYVFQDKRSVLDFDIYAHHLYANGSALGILESTNFVESKVFPNPFSTSATIEIKSAINHSQSAITFVMFDVFGKELRRTVIPSSARNLLIERGNLQSGIYFYEIKINNNAVSKGKLVLAD